MVDTDNKEVVLFFIIIPFYIIGFIGNVLVIRIVHKTREMHTTPNYLLVNLASELITILMAPLYFFSHLNGHLSDGFGKFVCKFLPQTEISIVVSSFTLTVLAVERYHALLKPFRTGLRIKEENIKLVVALIWISSILFCLPFFCFPTMERIAVHMYWSMEFTHESSNKSIRVHKRCFYFLYPSFNNALLLWMSH